MRRKIHAKYNRPRVKAKALDNSFIYWIFALLFLASLCFASISRAELADNMNKIERAGNANIILVADSDDESGDGWDDEDEIIVLA